MTRIAESTFAALTLALTLAMTLTMTSPVSATVAAFGGFTSTAETRLFEPGLERHRQGHVINLGSIQIGDGLRGESTYRLDLTKNPGLQCNLSHIKFTATGNSIWLAHAFVEYAGADRLGQFNHMLDLTSGQPPMAALPGRPGRHDPHPVVPTGVHLAGSEQSEWLSVDDEMNGFPDGRCIRAITFYGIDTPDFAGPGQVDRHDLPAMVMLDGYITRQPRGDSGGAGPGRPEPGGISSGPARPRRLQFIALAETAPIGKFTHEYIGIHLGQNLGGFAGLKVIAKDASVNVRSARVDFDNGKHIELVNFNLRENQEVYINFDTRRRGDSRDQDRVITRVTFEAVSSNMFGSKGRLEIKGGR